MQIWLIGKNGEINLNGGRDNSMYVNPDLEGFAGFPEIRTSQGVNIGMDGGWTGDQNFDARFLSINGVIADQDIAVVEQRRRELAALLSEKTLLIKYVTDGGNTYSTNVVALGFLININRKQSTAYKLNLKADDPIWYDYGGGSGIVATLNIEQDNGGFEIDFTFPLEITGGASYSVVRNTGTTPVDSIITIFGAIHQPTVINDATNQQMQILADLSDTDVIIINTKLKTIIQTDIQSYNTAIAAGQEPTGVDIYHLKADGSEFITLTPGDNIMHLTSAIQSDNGYAEVKYSSGYMGI